MEAKQRIMVDEDEGVIWSNKCKLNGDKDKGLGPSGEVLRNAPC